MGVSVDFVVEVTIVVMILEDGIVGGTAFSDSGVVVCGSAVGVDTVVSLTRVDDVGITGFETVGESFMID